MERNPLNTSNTTKKTNHPFDIKDLHSVIKKLLNENIRTC